MSEKSWLEVSLKVDGEMAEAVAEVMARYMPGGVVIESTAIAPDPEGEGHLAGPLLVSGYLPVDINLEDTRRRLDEALWYLGRIRPLPALQFKTIQEKDWTEAWKLHYQPVPIGRRLIVQPAWIEAHNMGRIPIRIDPGMAFGTGTHPTTQLCLEMLEDWFLSRGQRAPSGDAVDRPRVGVQPLTGDIFRSAQSFEVLDVIDIGCGSGILSIAACKLGAQRVLGVDTDSQAIAVARENAALNGVVDHLEFGVGSVADIRAGAFSIRQAPLVLVNILAPVIIHLLEEGLGELITPEGFMILSGILDEQLNGIEAALREFGLRVLDHRRKGDWVALGVSSVT